MADYEKHYEKVKRIKFFSRMHESLNPFFEELRSSIFTDVIKDKELMDAMSFIQRSIEAKLLDKGEKHIHIDSIHFSFNPECFDCAYINEGTSLMNLSACDIMDGIPKCKNCGEELQIKPRAKVNG